MSAWDWAAAIAGSWIVVSVVIAVRMGKEMARVDRAERPQYPPPVKPSLYKIPDWMRPPVPESDATWLAPWPTDDYDQFWWLADDDTVNTVINEMEGEFS